MKKRVFYFFCLLLIAGMAIGLESGWENISTSDNSSSVGDAGTGNESASLSDGDFEDVTSADPIDKDGTSGDGTYFTLNFYIALGLILIFLLILGFFAWLWLTGPKNKWEK